LGVRAGRNDGIPAVRELLEKSDELEEIVLLDALHTSHKTARGSDDASTVKDNQPGLNKESARLLDEQTFPPPRFSLLFRRPARV